MTGRFRGVRAAAIGVACGLAACANHEVPGIWAVPEADEAAAAAAAGPDPAVGEGPLFRSALVLAHPLSPAYDPREAADRLRVLLETYPHTRHREVAIHLLPLLYEASSSEVRMEEQADRIGRLSEQIAHLRSDVDRLQRTVVVQEDRTRFYREIVEGLQQALVEREGRVRILEDMLQRIQEIDLNPAPAAD